MQGVTSYNHFRPTTSEILTLVRDVAASRNARVRNDDVFDDGETLMVRAVLSGDLTAISHGDYVSSGFAVRVAQEVVSVFPFVLRRICVNGAVLPAVADARRLERVAFAPHTLSAANFESARVLTAIEEEVDRCANANLIQEWIGQVRETSLVEGLRLLMSGYFRRAMARRLQFDPWVEVVERFHGDPEGDETAFAILNAITSLARDASDPHRRWSLEEFGGAFPAWLASNREKLGTEIRDSSAFVTRARTYGGETEQVVERGLLHLALNERDASR